MLELRAMFAQLNICGNGSLLSKLKIQPVLIDKIKEAPSADAKLAEKIKPAQCGDNENFSIYVNNFLRFQN